MIKRCLLIAVCLSVFAVIIQIHRDISPPIDYLIPLSYRGKFRVKWNTKGALPLPMTAGHQVARIPADGVLKTSTAQPELVIENFYAVDKAGNKHPLLLEDHFFKSASVWGFADHKNETVYFVGVRPTF